MKSEVRLRITATMLERLLNRSLARGASFDSIRRTGRRSIIVDCGEGSADILLKLCAQYHLECAVLRRRGKSALLSRLRRRLSLPTGLILCAALCCAVLSHVWLIDIQFTGPSAHLGEKSALLGTLESQGVYVGMPASALDCDLLQKQLLAKAGAYSHIGVRKQGICLLVEAAPEIPAPELYEIGLARDLVSSMDGVVASVNVKSGQACVKAGDTVRKGQVLIRGEEEKSAEETAAVGALGEVYVRSWFEGSAEGDLIESRIRRTGRSGTSDRLQLMHWSFPLTKGPSFSQSESETTIQPIVGILLPLEIHRETVYETQTIREDINTEALKQRLLPLARAQARCAMHQSVPAAYEITDYWEEFTIENNVLRARAVYEITADVAVSRDALAEEVNQTWKAADK